MKERLTIGVYLKLRVHHVVPDKKKYTKRNRQDAKKEIRNG